MITKYLQALFGKKLPCSVYVYKTLMKVVNVGPAEWSNPNYRAVQIEDIKVPFSGIAAVAKITKCKIYQTKDLPENKWFYCQHWNKNYTKGHAYFYFRTGEMHIIADSTEIKSADIRVTFGTSPLGGDVFQAVEIR